MAASIALDTLKFIVKRSDFRRLNAASLYRPWRPPLFGHAPWSTPGVLISVWSDEPGEVDDALSFDVFPGDGSTLELRARVLWVDPQPNGAAARFEVGLRVSSPSWEVEALLERLLSARPVS